MASVTVVGLVIAIAVASSALAGSSSSRTDGAWATTALLASLLVGLPHGAVDVCAPVLTSRGKIVWGAGIVVYAAVAAAVYLVWTLQPQIALLALLLLAAAHFGAADSARSAGRAHRLATAVALGGVPVAAPIALHAAPLTPVLSVLSGNHPDTIVAAVRVGFVLSIVACAICVALAVRAGVWSVALDVGLLLALFVLVSPLVAFAVYFGLWHSLRQGAAMITAVALARRCSLPTAAAGLMGRAVAPSLVAVLVAVLLVATRGDSALAIGLIAVLCLTVPHSICATLDARHSSGHRRAPHTPGAPNQPVR